METTYYSNVKAEEQEVIQELLMDRSRRWNGTDQYWKHLFGLKYTDGVKAHAELAQAFWLIDAIASWQPQVKTNRHKHNDWIVWFLDVKLKRHTKERYAVLTARADENEEPFITQKIEFTDHPVGKWEFWQEGDVVIIPEEH